MQTLDEIIDRYENYSNIALVEAYSKIEDYTEFGKEALSIVINKRGGIELLKKEAENHLEIENEEIRIKKEIWQLLNQNRNIVEIISEVKSDKLSSSDLEKVITKTYKEFEDLKADKEVKPATIVGGIAGAIVGGLIGGVIWGVQLIYTGKMYVIFLLVLSVISYGCVRIFTKQSQKNTGVIVMTVLSVILAGLFGVIIYFFIGRLEVK